MRWLFRFAVYFLKPIAISLIIGYFGFLSIKATASAVSSYMKAERKAERAERAKALKAEIAITNTNTTAGAAVRRRKRGGAPEKEGL